MNPRHAAALALVGWYLMVPPSPVAKYWERPPLSKWEQYQSFDTAAECENRKSDETFRLAGKLPNIAPSENQLLLQFTIGQCIASDDPRLKER